MAKKTKWTDDRRKELMDFFKTKMAEGSTSVNQNAEDYAKVHNDVTPSQVRVAYYKFANEKKYAKNATKRKQQNVAVAKPVETKTYKNGRWTHKENMELLNAVENKGYDSLLEVFSRYSEMSGRNPKNVSQHYYILKNQKEYIRPTKATATENNHKNIVQSVPQPAEQQNFSLQQLDVLKELMSIPHETMNLNVEIARLFSQVKINN